MQRRHILTGLGTLGEAGMSPFVPLEVTTGVGGALIVVAIFAYRMELRVFAARVFHSREERAKEIVRQVLEEREEKRMRRIAEATVMHYVEDPEQRNRIAEKIRERWEKEDEAARRFRRRAAPMSRLGLARRPVVVADPHAAGLAGELPPPQAQSPSGTPIAEKVASPAPASGSCRATPRDRSCSSPGASQRRE